VIQNTRKTINLPFNFSIGQNINKVENRKKHQQNNPNPSPDKKLITAKQTPNLTKKSN